MVKKKIDKAIKEAKTLFDNKCLFCESPRTDGAHIVPRGYKTSLGIGLKLRELPVNIIPLCRYHHKQFDWTWKEGGINSKERTLFQKLRMLRRHVVDDQRIKLFKNLVVLKKEFKNARNESNNQRWY